MKVLCTLAMDPAGLALLDEAVEVVVAPDPGAETLYSMIGDADFLVVRNQLPQDLFERPNRLLGVIRHGVGVDIIPVGSATAHAIPVANVPGSNARAVAEYCVGCFLSFARGIDNMGTLLRSAGWNHARAQSAKAGELGGKTAGIIGVGAIGASLANLCRNGFGMRVLGFQRNPATMPDFVESVDLDTLFATSDFVSLNCPLTSETRHLVNAERLRRMKPTAIIVNAGRGALIDEQALLTALRENWIRGAALDVFSSQPLAVDHPLLKLDNALLTPHVAGLTTESSRAMGTGTARQIRQLMAGERPEHLVNPEVWDRYLARRRALEERR
jgi:D-3-phosphoglycerate dehydrogenase / 2-oxoglutarate reductase